MSDTYENEEGAGVRWRVMLSPSTRFLLYGVRNIHHPLPASPL